MCSNVRMETFYRRGTSTAISTLARYYKIRLGIIHTHTPRWGGNHLYADSIQGFNKGAITLAFEGKKARM